MSSDTGARMSYAAALVSSVTYGIYALLAFNTFERLIYTRERWTLSRKVLLAYTALLFVSETIYFIAGCKWSAIEFVDAPVDPAIFAGQLSSKIALLKDTMYTITIWIADSFILYRAFIILGGRYLVYIPLVTYIGSIATGIGLLVQTAKPGAVFGQANVINFGTPFWSLSVATNVISTLLIAGRLLYRRRMLRDTAGGYGATQLRMYTSAVAIFAESAALYAICAIVYIPMFAKNIPLQYPFSSLLGSMSSIAPTLIILRMAKGKAVTREWSNVPMNDLTPSVHTDARSYDQCEDVKRVSDGDLSEIQVMTRT